MTRDSDSRQASSDTGTADPGDGSDDTGEGSGGVGRRDFLKSTGAAAAAGATGVLSSGTAAAYTKETPPIETPWYSDVSPSNARPEYPRPQMTRSRWENLNGVWGFETASAGDPVPTGQSLSEEILVPFPVESALSGLMRQETRMWYRRTFSVPSGWDVGNGERLYLHFEAVDWETTVYVNGTQVTNHVGGFDHFVVDVTDQLTGGTEEVILNVYDPTEPTDQVIGKQRNSPGGIFYTPASGVWGTVWMEPVPTARIESLDTTPDLSTETLSVSAETTGASGLTLEAVAYDDAGNQVGSASGTPGDTLSVPVSNPTLWSPENPYLYDLTVRLVDGSGTVVDSVDSYFGMRSVGVEVVDGNERLTLNGEVVFHMGTLDQGYWPDGIFTAPTDTALAYDVQRHADMGFNTIRKHTKVEPRRWYYHADRLGLLVWQDMASPFWDVPTAAERQRFEDQLTTMIEDLDNHPSIAVWIPFNEGWGNYDPAGITDLVRTTDPTRVVDTHSGVNVCGCPQPNGDVLDWHNYTGPHPAPPTDGDRVTAVSEYGGIGLPIENHLWDPNEDFSYAGADSVADLTQQYVDKIDQTRDLMESEGLGAAMWTQITDVEIEINGLITYDREVDKVVVSDVAAANRALIEASRGGASPSDAVWSLDDGVGATATDSTGDTEATLVGDPQWIDGARDGALDFDGTDDYVDAGDSVAVTSIDYSVSAWVRFDDLSTWRTAVSQDGQSVSAFFLQYSSGPDAITFSCPDSDATGSVTRASGPSPNTGQWYHLVGVHDATNGEIRLYVDGSLAGTASYSGGFATDGNTVVGRGLWGGNQVDFFDGAIDQVHVFRDALTDGEVAELHASESSGGLTSRWPMDDGSGSTATDVAGSNDATLVNGPTWTTGVRDGALNFDGTDDYADAGASVADTDGDYTVAAWARFDDLSTWRTVVSQEGSTSSAFFLQYSSAPDALTFSAPDSDSTDPQTARAFGPSPTTGEWYHLVGVHDSAHDELRLYVDGDLVDVTPYNDGFATSGPTIIGRGQWNGNQVDFHDGQVDDVRVYDRALSATEIESLATGEPITRWPMDDGSGSTATDVAGSADASLVGDPAWVAGQDGQALDFDGTDDYADAGASVLDTAADYSVSARVRFDDLSTWRTAVSQDGGNVSAFFLQYSAGPDAITFSCPTSDATGSVTRASGPSPTTGQWYDLVGVHDSATDEIRLYVDGSLAGTASYSDGFATSGNTVVGRALWGGSQVDFFDGQVDDVRLYDRVLGADEIANLAD